MELELSNNSLPVYEALANQTRLDILNVLGEGKKLNLSEIADRLNLSNPMITRHVQKLLQAHLIKIEKKPGLSGIQKIVTLNVEEITIHMPQKLYPEFSVYTSNIGVGMYSNYSVQPTCGLVGPTGRIGLFDHPQYFSDNNRMYASLLWFTEGFVEYSIPNPLTKNQTPELLEFSLELSSEFQLSNNNWPSDITVEINGIEIGTYTVPGNYSDVRGLLTPNWWDDNLSQYGLLKHFRINHVSSAVDAEDLSDITIDDLKINDLSVIKLRLFIKENAHNRGGLTIFGEDFGNHPQNIKMQLFYSEKNS